MYRARRAPLLVGLLLALAWAAWSQAPAGLQERRSFYQDVAGYHAQGKAEAADRAEAQRLAKAAALKRLFSDIGRDTMFAEMCISGWPEYITVEDTASQESGGMHLVQVQVVVATSAIMLTEQKYQVAVAELLSEAERGLAEVEGYLAEADGFERNLKVAEAVGAFRRARTRAAEARELVRDVGDKSSVSRNGNNITAILARLDALGVRISGGLDRMQAIELETRRSAAADEMTKAHDLYRDELADMEGRAEEYVGLSPFYDLPRSRLEAILLEVQGDRERDARVIQELERLRAAIPQDRDYLRQSADMSLVDARTLARRLERMESELHLEITTPRLVRQERAQRRSAALAAVGKVARYAFLHRPADIVTVTWDLPFRWDMENPVRGTGEADVLAEVDGVFAGGFWIRGGVGHEVVTDTLGADTWRSAAWSSGLDLGFGKKTVFGLGVGWDWARSVADTGGSAGPVEAERELELRLNLGGVDLEQRRVRWMLSLGYTLPTVPAGEILIPYHLNAHLALSAKAADVLILRAAVRTKAYQSAAWADGVPFADAFSYRLEWVVGLGLRLPPPFILGVFYGGSLTAGLGPGGLEAPDPHRGAWGFELGYVY